MTRTTPLPAHMSFVAATIILSGCHLKAALPVAAVSRAAMLPLTAARVAAAWSHVEHGACLQAVKTQERALQEARSHAATPAAGACRWCLPLSSAPEKKPRCAKLLCGGDSTIAESLHMDPPRRRVRQS